MSTYMPARRTGFDLGFTYSQRPWRRTRLAAAAAVLGLAVWAACGAPLHRSEAGLTELRDTDAGGQAAAVLVTGPSPVERKYGYVTVTGEVANSSSHALRNVEVVVELLNAERRVVGVDSAMAEFATMRPGEQSPYRVQCREPAGISAYRVRFRQLLGAAIPSASR